MFNQQSTILSLCLMAAALPLPAKIIYFATTGLDTNPCTYAKPCKSFNAIAQGVITVNAGDTILALDGVDFNDQQSAPTFFINSVTIDGGAHGAFMTGIAEGAAVNFQGIAYSNFVLRNVTLVAPAGAGSQGVAIYLNQGGTITMENVTVLLQGGSSTQGMFISNSGGSGTSVIHLDGVRVDGIGDGLFLQTNSSTQVTADNVSTDVTGTGMLILDGYGAVRNSNFRTTSAPGSTGLSLQPQFSSSILVDTCSFKNLQFGLTVGAGATVRISNSAFSGNATGVFNNSTGVAISFRNNVFAGNGVDGAPTLTTSLK
jgi:hypothetical protein